MRKRIFTLAILLLPVLLGAQTKQDTLIIVGANIQVIYKTVFDTTHVTVYDTVKVTTYNKVTLYDTVKVTVSDTIWYSGVKYISVTDTLFIDVRTFVGWAEYVDNRIRVYPNPAHDHLIIDVGDYENLRWWTMKIYDPSAVMVYETEISQQVYEIDLSTWSGPGLYILVVGNGEDDLVARKIVLQ